MSSDEDSGSCRESKRSRESCNDSVGRSNPLPTHVAEKGAVDTSNQRVNANSGAVNFSSVSEGTNTRSDQGNGQPRPPGFVTPPSPAELGNGQQLVGRRRATLHFCSLHCTSAEAFSGYRTHNTGI